MKIEYENEISYVIMTMNSGTRCCFWGESLYGGLHTHNYISCAFRFDTKKEAERYIEKNREEGPAKAVRALFRKSVTIYTKGCV